jgi:hypothetical protein
MRAFLTPAAFLHLRMKAGLERPASGLERLTCCGWWTAPYRNATTRGWLAETQQRISSHPMGWEALLPDIFDFVHGKLEEMGLDVLNWQLRSIAPWLQMHGVAYENDNFNRLLAANQVRSHGSQSPLTLRSRNPSPHWQWDAHAPLVSVRPPSRQWKGFHRRGLQMHRCLST